MTNVLYNVQVWRHRSTPCAWHRHQYMAVGVLLVTDRSECVEMWQRLQFIMEVAPSARGHLYPLQPLRALPDQPGIPVPEPALILILHVIVAVLVVQQRDLHQLPDIWGRRLQGAPRAPATVAGEDPPDVGTALLLQVPLLYDEDGFWGEPQGEGHILRQLRFLGWVLMLGSVLLMGWSCARVRGVSGELSPGPGKGRWPRMYYTFIGASHPPGHLLQEAAGWVERVSVLPHTRPVPPQRRRWPGVG